MVNHSVKFDEKFKLQVDTLNIKDSNTKPLNLEKNSRSNSRS